MLSFFFFYIWGYYANTPVSQKHPLILALSSCIPEPVLWPPFLMTEPRSVHHGFFSYKVWKYSVSTVKSHHKFWCFKVASRRITSRKGRHGGLVSLLDPLFSHFRKEWCRDKVAKSKTYSLMRVFCFISDGGPATWLYSSIRAYKWRWEFF